MQELLSIEALGIEESQVMSMNNSLNEQLMLEQKQRRAKEELARQTVDYFEKLHFQSLVEKDLITNAHELDRETGTLNRTKQESIELTEEEWECIRVCVSNAPIPYDITKKKIPANILAKIGQPTRIEHEGIEKVKYDLTPYGIYD